MTRLVKRLPRKCEFLFVSENDFSKVYRSLSGRVYIKYSDGSIFSLAPSDMEDLGRKIMQYAFELEQKQIHESETSSS